MANHINYYNALLGRLFDDGRELPLRGGLNFLGFSVTPSAFGYDLALDAEVPATRKVSAGVGLTGGGDLSVDRVIDVGVADATIIATADAIKVGVLGPTNFADNTIALNRLVQGVLTGTMIGRNASGSPIGWSECTPAQLNLLTATVNSIALSFLANAAAQFRIVGRRTAGAGAWEDCTAAQLNLLTTAANSIALANLANATAQFRVMGRKTAGAGAWEECTGAQLGLVQNFDVTRYGAIGDGVANDTVAIQTAAAAAVAAGGGVVYFPPGQYRMVSGVGVTVANAPVVFRGAGRRQSFIRPETTGDLFVFSSGATGCGVEDLAIERTSGNIPTGGATFLFSTTSKCFVRNVSMSKCFTSFFVVSSPDLLIENCSATQTFSTRGVSIEGTVGTPTERMRIVNFTGRNPYGATPVRRGPWATATAYVANDVVFSNGSFWQAQNSATSGATAPILAAGPVATAHTTPVSDGAVNWLFISALLQWIFVYDYTIGLHVDGAYLEGGDYGLLCTGTGALQSGHRVYDLDVVNPWTSGTTLDRGGDFEFHGLRITRCLDGLGLGVGAVAGNFRFIGGMIQLCRGIGILINGGTDIHLRALRVLNNSQSGPAGANGITTVNGLQNFSIVDCQISGANHAAGIGLGSTNDQYVIVGNDLTGNAGPIGMGDNSALTATKRVVRGNIAAEEESASIYVTGRTTQLPVTNFFTFIPRPGLYQVNIYTMVMVVGGGSMDHQVNYQDDLGPTSYITVAGSERATLNALTRTVVRSVLVRHTGISHISLQTIFNGASGTYNMYATCQRMGNVAGL